MTVQRGNDVLQLMMAAMADLFWPLWRTRHERLAAICCPLFVQRGSIPHGIFHILLLFLPITYGHPAWSIR